MGQNRNPSRFCIRKQNKSVPEPPLANQKSGAQQSADTIPANQIQKTSPKIVSECEIQRSPAQQMAAMPSTSKKEWTLKDLFPSSPTDQTNKDQVSEEAMLSRPSTSEAKSTAAPK